jgi:hypothetical protein
MAFYASYKYNVNADYSTGVGSPVPQTVGSVAITSQKLQIGGGVASGVTYDINTNVGGTGAMRIKYTPLYTNAPSSWVYIMSIGPTYTSNELLVYHTTGGDIVLRMFDSAGTRVINTSLGLWNTAVSGTEYEFELDFVIPSSGNVDIKLFKDGTLFGSNTTNITTPRIASSGVILRTDTDQVAYREFAVFNTVQHTTNYTAGYSYIGLLNIRGATGATGSIGTTAYFAAYRITASSVTVTTAVPGTAVAFPTVGQNYSLSGSWSYNGTTQEITVPMTGRYAITYMIVIRSSSGVNYRITSSCIYVNGAIVAGTGCTSVMHGTSVHPHVNNCILALNAGDLIIVYAVANGANSFIAGTSSLYTSDNTSTSITIVMVNNS